MKERRQQGSGEGGRKDGAREGREVKERAIFWSRPWIQKPLGYSKSRNDWPHRVKMVIVNKT